MNKYKQSEKGKITERRYRLSDKNKAVQKRYRQSEAGKRRLEKKIKDIQGLFMAVWQKDFTL